MQGDSMQFFKHGNFTIKIHIFLQLLLVEKQKASFPHSFIFFFHFKLHNCRCYIQYSMLTMTFQDILVLK